MLSSCSRRCGLRSSSRAFTLSLSLSLTLTLLYCLKKVSFCELAFTSLSSLEMRRARTRGRVALLWCLSICLVVSVCVLITGSDCLDIRSSSLDTHHKQVVEGAEGIRRSLGGPGSFPPRCIGKCGRCTPCHPVHVTVPPGTPVTTEYYPEAWRCKCGNRLYIP